MESLRFGVRTRANELNPVAAVILQASLRFPLELGERLVAQLEEFGGRWVKGLAEAVDPYFPKGEGLETRTCIWANAVTCPYCKMLVPLLPNLWLDKKGEVAVRFVESDSDGGIDSEEDDVAGGDGEEEAIGSDELGETADGDSLPAVVDDAGEPMLEIVEGDEIDFDPKSGTVRRGKGSCPHCGEVIDGSFIKAEAQAGRMKDYLYAVANKDHRGLRFRQPIEEDLVSYKQASDFIEQNLELMIQDGLVPFQRYPRYASDKRPVNYGRPFWYQFFNTRQLLSISSGVRNIQRLSNGLPDHIREAVITYLALCISKIADYNSKGAIWDSNRCNVAHAFGRHDFSFKWTFGEIPMTEYAQGGEWVLNQILDAYSGICSLVEPTREVLFPSFKEDIDDLIQITQGDGADLEYEDGSVTAVVVDPPYYDNVQYAELSDFFYVWMRLTLKDIYPDWFVEELTEKDQEAVKNKSRFVDIDPKRAKQMAKDDYERKMTRIFKEAYRVLRDDGVMTVMFNHKDLAAWDTLAMSLIEAGFEVVSSWPIHTESQHSLHQANKAASASTILLTCRKRIEEGDGGPVLWDDIADDLKEEVRNKIVELQSGWSRVSSVKEDKTGKDSEGEKKTVGNGDGEQKKAATEEKAGSGPVEGKSDSGESEKEGSASQQNGKGNENGNGLHRVDGVDLFIAVFGPALSVISRKWPVVLSELDPNTHRAKVLSPGMALDYAREVIVESRIEELFGKSGYRGDPESDWYLIAWSIFGAREIPFDEANKMAKTLKLEVSELAKTGLVEKKGSKVLLATPKARLEGLKKTTDEQEPESVVDYVHCLMAAALDRGVAGVNRVVSRVEEDFSQDDRFSRSNTERYLQALIDSVPRVRDRDGEFELDEGKGLDLLGDFFQDLTYPPETKPTPKMEQDELGLDADPTDQDEPPMTPEQIEDDKNGVDESDPTSSGSQD